jgi:hypothetical protein
MTVRTLASLVSWNAFEFDVPGFMHGLLCPAAGGGEISPETTHREVFTLNLTAL